MFSLVNAPLVAKIIGRLLFAVGMYMFCFGLACADVRFKERTLSTDVKSKLNVSIYVTLGISVLSFVVFFVLCV